METVVLSMLLSETFIPASSCVKSGVADAERLARAGRDLRIDCCSGTLTAKCSQFIPSMSTARIVLVQLMAELFKVRTVDDLPCTKEQFAKT